MAYPQKTGLKGCRNGKPPTQEVPWIRNNKLLEAMTIYLARIAQG